MNADKGFLISGVVDYILTWFLILVLNSEQLIQVHLKQASSFFGNNEAQLNKVKHVSKLFFKF